jgi:hypothetical protein
MNVKAFILKLFLFLLPLAAGMFIVEYKLSSFQNSYNLKRAYFERESVGVEVINVGSSQALYGINPAFFSFKGFNLANVSQTLFYDKRLVLTNIKKLPKLKLVIIPINYTSFYHQLYDTEENWRDYYYYRFWNIKYQQLSLVDAKYYSLVSLYSLPYTIRILRSGGKLKLTGDMLSSGFSINDTTNSDLNISDSSGLKRVMIHNKVIIPHRFKEITDDLDDFLKQMQAAKIKVAFISIPVYTTYSKYLDPAVNKANAREIALLCSKYSCSYYDFLTDQRFEKKDFADNDHLNFIGAEHFSKILEAEVLEKELGAKKTN